MLKTFSATDIGRKRKLNQDYVYTSEQPVGPLKNLFIVADGMGGHNAGDYASRYTVETMAGLIENATGDDVEKVLNDAIQTANRQLRKRASEDESLYGMGTTVVACTVDGRYLHVANVGDSRLYLIRQGGSVISQITKDHSLVQEMVRMGGLDEEEARNSKDKNIITRAVGASEDLLVDFFHLELAQDDMILMCSDGLTNMLEDEEIRMIVSGQRDIVEKAQKLISEANEHGGKDNIAVVLVEPFGAV